MAIAVLSLGLAVAPGARAQSCPADLSSLTSQIQEDDLRALLTTPMDTIVAQAGSLAQAIADTNANIASLTSTQANLGNADDADTHQYVTDAILIANTQLSALQCRQGG